jgi:hypothetical protein
MHICKTAPFGAIWSTKNPCMSILNNTHPKESRECPFKKGNHTVIHIGFQLPFYAVKFIPSIWQAEFPWEWLPAGATCLRSPSQGYEPGCNISTRYKHLQEGTKLWSSFALW